MNPALGRLLAGVGVIALVVLGSLGLLLLREGDDAELRELLTTGEVRELQPALFQSAPLRTAQGGADRVYLVSSQSETITRIADRRSRRPSRRELLHFDLWAIDPTTATVAWRKRLRTLEGAQRAGVDLRSFDLLGVDGRTLWLTLDGPLGVSLVDGNVVADGARIDAANPAMAGKRVNDPGYIAFGRHGLQLTLSDASQWRIDANGLRAAPRDTPVRDPRGIVPPADYARGASSTFMTRALPIGERWLGLMTEQEAELYRNPPVVPGRAPGERPGAMQQFLEANHVPPPLHQPAPQPYRLWAARVVRVSAAPPDWPREWPDNWGTRPQFSAYEVLPDAPGFLRAGLLRDSAKHDQALWYRQPDSVLVLHADKLGKEGRLQLTRVSGPVGKPVWSVVLPMDDLHAVMPKEQDLVLLGSEPPPASADQKTTGQGPHLKLVRVDARTGGTKTLDLTAKSLEQSK